jgi:undecaprenyl-diphosphatase
MDIKKIFFIDKFARRRKRDRFYFSVGIFLFALAALFVAQRYSAVDALDISVFRVINFLPGQLFFFLYYIMYTGAFEGAIGITIALLILKKFYIARDVITASFLAALSSGVLKILVNRGRPQDFLHHVIIRGAVEHSPGFPSGHTATAAAIATVIHPYLNKKWRPLLWLMVVLVGIGRIFVGAHFLSDVIGGALLGISIGSLTNFIWGIEYSKKKN